VVHLSTVAVYPRKDGPAVVTPDQSLDPFPELRDDYAWSKIGAERWATLYQRAGRLDVTTLRLGIVYGRGCDYVARVWRRLGPLTVVAGSPRMLVPLVHVDDVVEAVWRALDRRGAVGSALHVVGPDAPTQATYLARRAEARREPTRIVYVPIGFAATLVRRRGWRTALRAPAGPSRLYALAWAVQEARYDLGATARALGWTPRIGIDEGLGERAARTPAPVAAAG
jgi:nucleoside-diphosphate-sugar epimerase